MDTELARTFLTVIAAGNFSAAASRLFVTQSTVSTRIATLEQQLGCALFVRNKAGTTLTPEGRWFQSHATTLVRTVEQVRHEIGVSRGFRGAVTIGGRFGLWEDLLLHALPRIRQATPDIAVRSEIGFEDDLMRGLVEGRVDVGLMYTPQSRPGLVVRHLLDEVLIYVSTTPQQGALPGPGYVYVDWGPEFRSRHSAAFPEFNGAALGFNIGWLGLQYVLANGGAGYFPRRLVRSHIDAGSLHPSAMAPEISMPAYLVHAAEPVSEPVQQVLHAIFESTNP